jgi:hypothetical protein
VVVRFEAERNVGEAPALASVLELIGDLLDSANKDVR